MFCKEFLALNSRKCLAKAKQDTHKKYKKLFEPIVLGEERLFSSTFSHYIHSTQQYIGKKEVGRRAVCWSSSCYHFYHKTYFCHFFWILSKTHISFLKSKIHRGWIQNWKIRRSVEELFVGHPAATTSVTKHIFRPILLNLVHNLKVDLPSKIEKAEKYSVVKWVEMFQSLKTFLHLPIGFGIEYCCLMFIYSFCSFHM